MASYQDIETRLKVIEDKMDLTMKAIIISQPNRFDPEKTVKYSLYDLYIASSNAGLKLKGGEEQQNG